MFKLFFATEFHSNISLLAYIRNIDLVDNLNICFPSCSCVDHIIYASVCMPYSYKMHVNYISYCKQSQTFVKQLPKYHSKNV